MTKFKIGDKVRGKVYGSYKRYVTGSIITIDYNDRDAMYLVGTQDGSVWLDTYTVTLVEEKDNSNYDKLLTFVNENEISIATVNEVVKHLDKLEKLDVDIENTKKLCEQNENEAKRLYDELSELEKERSELLK